MKYRVLLMGNNKSIMDDIFKYTEENFEYQSTSSRTDDIRCHLKYFKPHILLYCMHNESYDVMQKLVNIKHYVIREKTFFVAVASAEDCAELRRVSVNVMDLEIEKPVTVAQITERLTGYLNRNLYDDSVQKKPEIQQEEQPQAKKMQDTIHADAAFLDELDAMLAAGPILPKASAAAQSGQTAPAQMQPQASVASMQPDTSKRKHILVVDDDFRMLKLVKRYLEDSYDVATAINGKVALKFLQTKMTNLILLDYEMPEENGPAVLEKLRANPITNSIPVIFLTGINDSKKIRQVLSLKPQGYLLKPIEHDKLINEIQKVIG